MRDDIHREVIQRLKSLYRFEDKGSWLQRGKCPACDKREMFTHGDHPWVLRCGRLDRCGKEFHVKELFPDIFDVWSKRHKQTEEAPNAAADAYLSHARGFDLRPLRGHYSQEWFVKDNARSATVRFPLPGGGYWERLIDQPSRFGKQKGRFPYGKSYRGQWWAYPGVGIEDLAKADRIWIAEGIFDAIDLVQKGKLQAVSTLSCNNYPEHALAALRKACGDLNRPTPKLIWAYDVGAAGTRYIREFVKRSREDGWDAGAAQAYPDGDGEKLDWNDLGQRGRLTPTDLETYQWNGEVTIAPDARAKAILFYDRDKIASFPLVFGGRQLWASFSNDSIQGLIQSWLESDDPAHADFKQLPFEEQWQKAAAHAVDISELANCTFRTLYFQRDPNIEEGAYYLRVDFPTDRPNIRATFSGSACTASGEFKKRLASVAPGALWTGNEHQITKLMQRQWARIQTVEAIQFTGYSKDHEAWVLGDLAVHKGRVYEPNDEDYFVLSKKSVKLRTTERHFRNSYDPDKLDQSWLPHLVTSYRAKGTIVLTFWVLSLFAEHVRGFQASLAFLEASGQPGTGKSTLIEFLWKLFGRADYEGFDPTKGTAAGIARNLGQVAGMPVVLLEGDRTKETLHSKKFEWDELKTAYNGRAVRTRAIANGGMETFEPPFRGAIVIAQNEPLDGSDAITERVMGLHFDKSHFSAAGKVAAEAMSAMPIEQISGFPIHVMRREEDILARYREAFKAHETAMGKLPFARNGRLVKNHAQLAAMLDAMRVVLTDLRQPDVDEAHQLIRQMLEERHQATEKDHAHVVLFWERFDELREADSRSDRLPPNAIDHSRVGDVFAVSMVHFEQRCAEIGLRMPCPMAELKKLLKGSKARKFIGIKAINSAATGKTKDCWVFRNPNHQPSKN